MTCLSFHDCSWSTCSTHIPCWRLSKSFIILLYYWYIWELPFSFIIKMIDLINIYCPELLYWFIMSSIRHFILRIRWFSIYDTAATFISPLSLLISVQSSMAFGEHFSITILDPVRLMPFLFLYFFIFSNLCLYLILFIYDYLYTIYLVIITYYLLNWQLMVMA